MCPHCQYDIVYYNELPHEQKLVLALRHPNRDNRLLAIQLLGDLRSKSAIPVFRSMIQQENDFYLIREITRSLRKIRSEESEELLSTLSKHKSKLIRNQMDAK